MAILFSRKIYLFAGIVVGLFSFSPAAQAQMAGEGWSCPNYEECEKLISCTVDPSQADMGAHLVKIMKMLADDGQNINDQYQAQASWPQGSNAFEQQIINQKDAAACVRPNSEPEWYLAGMMEEPAAWGLPLPYYTSTTIQLLPEPPADYHPQFSPKKYQEDIGPKPFMDIAIKEPLVINPNVNSGGIWNNYAALGQNNYPLIMRGDALLGMADSSVLDAPNQPWSVRIKPAPEFSGECGIIIKSAHPVVLKRFIVSGFPVGICVEGGQVLLSRMSISGNGIGVRFKRMGDAVASGLINQSRFTNNAESHMQVLDEAPLFVARSQFEDSDTFELSASAKPHLFLLGNWFSGNMVKGMPQGWVDDEDFLLKSAVLVSDGADSKLALYNEPKQESGWSMHGVYASLYQGGVAQSWLELNMLGSADFYSIPESNSLVLEQAFSGPIASKELPLHLIAASIDSPLGPQPWEALAIREFMSVDELPRSYAIGIPVAVFTAAELEAMANLQAPDFQWVPLQPAAPQTELKRAGADAARQFVPVPKPKRIKNRLQRPDRSGR